MSEERRHAFFVPLMFIGMGIGFLLVDYLGGTAFVASMFIGMGIGFLLDSVFTIENRMVVRVRGSSNLFLFTLGAIMVVGGLLYIIFPKIIQIIGDYLVAAGFILFGLYIMFRAMERKSNG